MRYVVTADEMRALDAATIEEMGLPGAVLMETAGRRVVEVILEELSPTPKAGHVAVVCGAGNNGGDGYVIARCLRDRGIDAVAYLAAGRERVRGDAKLHLDAYTAMGHPVVDVADKRGLDAARERIESARLVVDGLFGTGLTREVSGHYKQVIEVVNRARGTRVAVDVPSGLSADTGHVLGVAVQADITVTMAFLKVGLATSPGYSRAGRVVVAEIGIPERLAPARGVATTMVEAADLASLVPRVGALDHKNRRGHLLVVAGSPGKRGAARLTAWAGLRAGAGLVTLAAPWRGQEPAAPDPVMTAELDPSAVGARDQLLSLARGKRSLAIGPGMDTGPGGRQLVLHALAELDLPMVLDADALNHLQTDLTTVARSQAPVVLTPHPGEAGRMLGMSSAAVERDRMSAVRSLARQSGAVVVLKGARSLICCGRPGARLGRVAINPTGNAALATAGSGDVLTGVIGALLAQGLDAFDAAVLATYLHGRSGELATAALGTMHAVTAADLPRQLGRAMREL